MINTPNPMKQRRIYATDVLSSKFIITIELEVQSAQILLPTRPIFFISSFPTLLNKSIIIEFYPLVPWYKMYLILMDINMYYIVLYLMYLTEYQIYQTKVVNVVFLEPV